MSSPSIVSENFWFFSDGTNITPNNVLSPKISYMPGFNDSLSCKVTEGANAALNICLVCNLASLFTKMESNVFVFLISI